MGAHFFCLLTLYINRILNFNDFLASGKSKNPHYLLIGNPIGHSISPIMHNEALKRLNLPGHYTALAVSNKDIPALADHCRKEEFLGANITIPHKEAFFDYLDELSEEAAAIGAVNTIVKNGGKLTGHNTDAYGFLEPVKPYLSALEGGRAIIFGTGGATKAIIYALRSAGIKEIILVSRRPNVYETRSDSIIRCGYGNWGMFADGADIIINATPLGMHPNKDASPVLSSEIVYLQNKICYDIVYNPRQTVFLKQAEEAGATAVGGLDMLIYQGAKSFNLWTGRDLPVDAVREVLADALPG